MIRLRFRPNFSSTAFDDPLSDGEPDPCSCVLITGVQPLKDAEDLLSVLLLESDPVVCDAEHPGVGSAFGEGRKFLGRLRADT